MLGHTCPKPRLHPTCCTDFCLPWSSLSSLSFPLYSSLFVKEEIIFAFPSGKSTVTGWEREAFSSGKGRTARCLGDAPEVLTLLLKNRSSLLVTLHGSGQEGCPFQRRDIDCKEPSQPHPLARGHCKTSPPLTHICLVEPVEILQITAEKLNYSS